MAINSVIPGEDPGSTAAVSPAMGDEAYAACGSAR